MKILYYGAFSSFTNAANRVFPSDSLGPPYKIRFVCNWGRIQRKTWWMEPYAGVDYNLALCPLQSRLQNIYREQPSLSESTLTLCQSRLYPPVRDFGFCLCCLGRGSVHAHCACRSLAPESDPRANWNNNMCTVQLVQVMSQTTL